MASLQIMDPEALLSPGRSFSSRVDSIVIQRRKTVLEDNRDSQVRFITVGEERRRLSQAEKDAASKVPMDMLAKEWLNLEEVGLESRYYLVDKLLPTLVIGLEKLLNEVSSRGLVESCVQEPDFNPINFVAQYLMRNNPHYSNFAEAHPYCKTMRQVSEELKRAAYSAMEGERLSVLRADSERRCLIRDHKEMERVTEENRRREILKDIYGKWIFHGEQTIRVVDMKCALQSWAEGVDDENLMADLQVALTSLLSNATSAGWGKPGFVSAMVQYSEGLPAEVFCQLHEYLYLWAEGRWENKQREKRKELFTSVFESCDPNGTNAVDRLRVLHLLDCYFESLSDVEKTTVRNPRQWPIMDVAEVEELEEEEDRLKSTTTITPLSMQDLLDFYEGNLEEEEERGKVGSEGKAEAAEGRETGGKEVGGDEKELASKGSKGGDLESKGSKGGDLESKGSKGGDLESKGSKGGDLESKGSDMESRGGDLESKGSRSGDLESKGSKGGDLESKGSDMESRGGDLESKGSRGSHDTASVVKSSSSEGKSVGKSSSIEKKASSVGVAADPSVPVKTTASEAPMETDSKPGPSHPTKPASLLERRLTAGQSRMVSLLRMREVCGMSSRPTSPSGPGAMWDHEQLNRAQFVHLVELFVGREPRQDLVDAIAEFIRRGYIQAEKDKVEQKDQAQLLGMLQAKRRRVHLLFDTWDNDSSGFLELEELQFVLCKWKDFSTETAMAQANAILQSMGTQSRLTRYQFHTYLDQLTENMGLEQCAQFFDYLIASIKLSLEEKHRGLKRKEFLAQITQSGKMSGLNFVSSAKEAVAMLHQDIKVYGDDKQVTVLVSMLEHCNAGSTRDTPLVQCLTVKAASPVIEARVLNSKVKRTSDGVGFKVLDTAMPIRILSIQKHGKVMFFLPEHKTSQFDGSLVVAPIINPQQEVLGTLSIDSLKHKSEGTKTSFYAHETNFLQGVGLCLGEVHHWISVHRKLLTVAQSALQWIHRRCAVISKGEVYIVQPTRKWEELGRGKQREGGGGEGEGELYQLCLMLSTTRSQPAAENINKTIHPHQNQFLDYLFECVENSEPVSAVVYGDQHWAYPIRDHTGCAVAVVDFSMPTNQHLTPHQLLEVTKVLKLLTAAYYKLSTGAREPSAKEERRTGHSEALEPVTLDVGEEEEEGGSGLFDQLMLTDLKDRVKRVDNKMFAELRSYMDPPQAVLQVIRALLCILHPEQEFDTWTDCKPKITVSLVKALESYNPLQVHTHPKLDLIKQLIDLPLSSLREHGSLPAKCIYNWVLACVPLLEYASVSVSAHQLTGTSSIPMSSSAPLPSITSSVSTVPSLHTTVSAPVP